MSITIGRNATVTLGRGVKINVMSEYIPGNSWYVSSTYTGTTSDGQLNTPWKTLSNVSTNIVNGKIKPGDTIYFKRGEEFTGSLTLTNRNGQPGKPYVFSAYGTGNKPKFTGNSGAKIEGLFWLQGSSYYIFDNLEVSDTSITDPNNRSILANIRYAFRTQLAGGQPASNITIQNCDISLVGIAAVFNPGCTNNTFTGCNVNNLRMNVSDQGGNGNDFGANGITLAASNNIITNNIFRNCWAVSFDFTYDGGGVEFFVDDGTVVENNFIGYNTFYNNNGTFEFGAKPTLGGTIRNNIIAYNKIINCEGMFYINNNGTFAVTSSNNQFYNNVILQTTESRFGVDFPPNMMSMASADLTRSNIVTLKNNIFFAKQAGTKIARANRFNSTNLIASNNVYTLQSGSIVNFTTGSTDFFSTGSFTQYWTDTTSPDPINWNYIPLANSILINNGVNVNQTRDFAGNPVGSPPDIGILERT